jgi:hypothetical protein
MNSVQKFEADIRRALKHDRHASATYDGIHACSRVAEVFGAAFPQTPGVAQEISAYWLKKYIEPAQKPADEPTQSHVDWLLDAYSFLEGSDDERSAIPLEDWKDIRDIISYEAGDMPVDILTQLMGRILDKKAL